MMTPIKIVVKSIVLNLATVNGKGFVLGVRRSTSCCRGQRSEQSKG